MPGLKPHEIELRSMEIIDGLLPPGVWSPGELTVVKRLVHTSGDPSLAEAVRFSEGAVEAGVAALRAGAPVFTDTHMARIGINDGRVAALGGSVECLIADEHVAAEARRTGRTRAATAMRALGPRLDGAVVALGNAPTALREVLALTHEGAARPALVIGMPVGFVDAEESKDALMASGLTFIAVQGTRGGSPLAAATVNALLRVLEAGAAPEGDEGSAGGDR
jgi:precorrin-8X/cobalt-precorrin-8 methylmutase